MTIHLLCIKLVLYNKKKIIIMNLDKYFLEIQEINKRINNEKKAVANLEYELRSKWLNFLKRLRKLKETKPLWAKSLLDRGLSTKGLDVFIDRLDRNEWGVLSKLAALKDNITTDFFENEYPNYNDVLNQLEVMYKRWDSLEDENLNNLFVTHSDRDYLIDREAEYLLKKGYALNFGRAQEKVRNDYVYLVVFNTIKLRDEYVLVYNYIPYHKVLFKLLYLYAILEQKYCLPRGKKGYVCSDFYFILDKDLRKPDLEAIDAKVKKAYPDFHSPDKEYINILDSVSLSNSITLAKWLSYGCIKDINFEEQGDLELIKYLIARNPFKVAERLNKGRVNEEIKKYTKALKYENVYNMLSRFIFIVGDLDKMENSLENKLKLKVNQGPQKFRGQCSYISHILFSIDKAFRESMCNHNRIHVEELTCNKEKNDRYIPKSCFSFKNIHINLGKVRW